MADVAKKLQAGHDKAAAKLSSVGLRQWRVWLIPAKAGDTEPQEDAALFGDAGLDPTPDPDPLELDPRPLVAQVSQRLVIASGGRVESGDIRISSITRRAEVEALVTNPATRYRVEGPAFSGVYQALDGLLTVELDQLVLVVRRTP